MMTQSWTQLLFAHWPVPADVLRPHIPAELAIDTFNGQAWLGIVPFRMGFQMRYWPCSLKFNELNVRTYVSLNDKPGVFFFSLDASDLFTVLAARMTYALPYFMSDIQLEQKGEVISFSSKRYFSKSVFEGRYRPTSPIFHANPGSLEHWLTERYCLYSRNSRQKICRAEVHHAPWPLQAAQADILENTLIQLPGCTLSDDPPPLLHYSPGVTVFVWPLKEVEQAGRPRSETLGTLETMR